MTPKRKSFAVSTILAAALFLSACATASPTPPPVGPATQSAMTLQAMLTQVALQASPTSTISLPTSTPVPPTATATLVLPTPTASWTPVPYGTPQTIKTTATLTTFCNAAFFVGDVTYKDGTVVDPVFPFTKTWDVRNIGTCTWDRSYRLIFWSGEHMDGPNFVNFPQIVKPGDHLFLSVNLLSPSKAGTYTGYWMLQAPDGSRFGVGDNGLDALRVKIVVP